MIERIKHHQLYNQLSIWETLGSELLRPGGLTLTERALALCQLAPGAYVLDIGCGSGATLSMSARNGYTCIGVDHSPLLLWRGCAEHGQLPLLQAQAEQLPLADGVIDAVLAECSLSVMHNRAQVLSEIHRVLKPNGRLVITDLYARNPDGLAELRRLSVDVCLSHAQSAQQIHELLAAKQLTVRHWEDHSECLQTMTACGSGAAFWEQTAGVDPFDLQLALARARLGYFLLVATK